MNMSEQGLEMLKGFEQCRLESYQDGGGVWTIGWGHTLGVGKDQTCTQQQADEWLQDDVELAAAAVNLYVRGSLGQNQFDALVDFTFNLGMGNLRSSTLLRMVNARDWDGAAAEFLRWDHDNGKVVKGLTLRRQAEKKLFEFK